MNNTCNYSTCYNVGLLLPILNESTWSVGARIFFYVIGMLWCFLGLTIVSDSFMCGIECITSKTKTVTVAKSGGEGFQQIEVKVWNDTVANLTLLAFGTSAPEILLNVIEICGQNFVAGDLGPGTIVGSAAFNLFIITSLSITCIPDGETR
ncbi:sodium/calcium exchanger 3 [Biomphalaria glabrata]|nr:sodium/calcium exchanger 3-like [Biomphalaria glabrata]